MLLKEFGKQQLFVQFLRMRKALVGGLKFSLYCYFIGGELRLVIGMWHV